MRQGVDPRIASVRVGQGDRSYAVLVGAGILRELPSMLQAHVEAHRFALIADHNVAALHGDAIAALCREADLDVTLFTFPAGEASKSRKSWSILTDELLDAGFGRDCCVVAVGGGVTNDLAGFVAATYMRGVPVVQVPTSYLAMIDASVGGKTGVDTRAGKNLVGVFHPPALVVADTETLSTLPPPERAQGLVEAYKHGAILDADYFARLEADGEGLLAAEPDVAVEAVLRSVRIKAAVVTEDEHEAGRRQILNFGHTVGHALEAASGFALGHGSAVARGMVVEARVGERLGATAPGTGERLERALGRLLGAAWSPLDVDPEDVAHRMASDKKARRGRTRCVLLAELGRVDPVEGWTHEVPHAIVVEALRS